MSQKCMIPVVKSLKDCQAYRISSNDTNKLAIVFDPNTTNGSLTACVEIFDVGSKVPLHQHQQAVEMFFIIKGEGTAYCDGKELPFKTGDSILMPPTGNHFIENTSKERLYALCIMVPNEDFAELIRSGTPVELDEEDLRVLSRSDLLVAS